MAVGKREIKLVLSLDDSGFSVKAKNAKSTTDLLEASFGGLGKAAQNLESSVSSLSKDMGTFAAGFTNLQKSLSSALNQLTSAVDRIGNAADKIGSASKGMSQLNASTTPLQKSLSSVSKEADNMGKVMDQARERLALARNGFVELDRAQKDSAAVAKSTSKDFVDARVRALEAEIANDNRILQARGKLHADLKKMESEAAAQGMSARMQAETGRNANGRFINVNNARTQADRYETLATAHGLNALQTEESIKALRNERDARIDRLATLKKEIEVETQAAEAKKAAAALAKDAAKQAKVDAQEAVANARRVAAAQQEAAQTALSAAREAARARMALARETAAAEREQAQQVAQMWKAMAQTYAGAKVGQGLKASVGVASDVEREKALVGTLALPKEEEDEIFASSKQMANQLKFISTLDAIKSRMSAISSLGHNNVEVIEQTLATAVKATNNLQYLGMSHGDTQSAIRNMYGVVEMRQQTADPVASNNTFETLQKIVTGTAGKVQVNDIETVLRRLGMGANSLSDNGLINLAAIVDQFKVAGGDGGAGGGVSTVGTAFKMMQAYAMGKGLSNTAVSQFADADILKTGGLDLSKDSAGVLRDAKHAGFKDADLWMRDPVAAVQKIMPKIVEYTQRKENRAQYYEGRDINDQQAQITAVTAYLARLGITTTASQALMVAGDPRSQKRIAEQNHTISNSKGIDEVAQSIEGTAGQKWSVAKAQLTDLGTAIGESIMPEVKALLDGLNAVLSAAVKFASENKMTTQVLAISAAFAGATLAFKGFTGMFGAASNGLSALSSLLNVAKTGTDSMTAGLAKASAAQVEATAANARHLTSVANSADATRAYTAAKLAEAQAHVQSVSGFKQLTAVQTVLVPAQQAHRVATETATAAQKAAAVAAAEHTAAQTALSTVASAASPIMRALSGALALVGGPIGAITLALTLGALAWDKFGSEASKAADKARKASEDSASAVEGALKRIREAKLAEEGVLGKDGKKVTGANASVIETERQELARLRGELIKSKTADQENATYAAEAAKYSDSGMVLMPKSNTADLQKQIAQREKNLSDLLQAEDEQNKRFAAKQAQQEKEAKEKIAVAGADKSNAAANKTVVDSAQPKDRKPRERIDPLTKALGEAEGKVNSQKIKLQALVNGTKELSTLREEAEAEVEGKRKAGDYNKDKDPNKPVAANDPRIAQLVEQVYQEKLLNEQVKAVQFANERNAASTLEADEAMKRIAGEGAAQQTDAFRALSRELVRAEERLGAGAASLQAWKSAKDEALAGQAKADLLNFSADMAEKSKTTNARYGYDTERERLVAERKAVEEAEEAKYKVRLDTLNRTRAARIADAQAAETDLVSREARIAQINKETDDTISAADEQMNKERQARALETARILERPIDALAREWRDKYKQLDDMTASWASGFLDTLTTALTTGKLNWRGFLSGMATDLLKTQLKDSFGKQITDMFGSLGSTVKGWFGAAPAAGGAATAAGAAATTGATAAATAGAAGAAGAAASTAASEAAAASMQAVANSSGQAAASMISLTAQGIEPAIASTVQQVAQDVTATATTELTSVSLGLLGDSAMFAAEAMMQAAAAAAGQSATSLFADGGIMSSAGSLPLKKYSNGGIANRPQLAIYGEGSMNEAYVPLPDGRSIPVTIETNGNGGGTTEGGGAGGTVVTIQINVSGDTSNSTASGDDKGVWTTMAARVKGIVQQELEVQKRPGGQLYSA